jgi:hypothetical protein
MVLFHKEELRVAEDEALASRSTGFSDYVSTRERMAWLGGRTVAEHASLLSAQTAQLHVKTALEQAQLLHRGIDNYRRDAETRLRIMTYERQLER